MVSVVRFDGTGDFPLAGGPVDFVESEIETVNLWPDEDFEEVLSQEQDLTIYRNGPEHWIAEIVVIVDVYQTLEKLEDLRAHRAPLTVYPSYRDEPTLSFEMLWRNPSEARQRLRKGFHLAGYPITMKLREPLGEACRPPEAVS